MKRSTWFFLIWISFFLATAQGQTVFADRIFVENIKTVQLYPQNDPHSEALIFLNEQHPLLLKFDELDSDYRDFAYTLIHCDSKWQQSDLSPNEYLAGYTEAYIQDYQFSQNTKIPFIHYSVQIPNDDIQIRYSGNYILKVYPESEPENPIFTKKFYVVNPLCLIGGNVVASSNPETRNEEQEISFKVNISTLNSRFPSREITTQIQQNGRYDNQINELEPLSIQDGILDFDLQKENVFLGLNTFRFFDFSSLTYNSEYVYSINRTGNIDEVELLLAKKRVNTPYKDEPTQFGKFYIESKEYTDTDSEAEYALVHFLLSSELPYPEGDVYILGACDLWGLKHKLTYDYSSKLYQIKILLKQGYYSYLYALKKKGENKITVAEIEGSFYQTPNSYFVRVYFRSPGTTFDQLVGWQEIKNYTD
jgi:hypothetical protein